MTISLGDKVFYHRHGSPNGEHKPEDSVAFVTKVLPKGENGEIRAMLFVMNPTGMYFNECTYGSGPGQFSRMENL